MICNVGKILNLPPLTPALSANRVRILLRLLFFANGHCSNSCATWDNEYINRRCAGYDQTSKGLRICSGKEAMDDNTVLLLPVNSVVSWW